jgi:rifampicin phosphotransferase
LVPVVVMTPGLAAENEAKARVERWLGDPALFAPIQRALPYNPTTEMGLELWRLARRLKSEGVEPTASHPGVAEFLARYGHRAVWEIDPGVPRWAENPTYVLEVLRGYMAQVNAVDQERQFQANEAAAREAAGALVARVRREKGRPRAWLLRRLIRLYREMGGLREQPKFDGARMIALARRVMREAGKELVGRGRLDDPDDVFFLTLADLRAADEAHSGNEAARIDLRARADQRRND